MKYPLILFYRYDKYEYIDSILTNNSEKLDCTLHIINKSEKLNLIYKQIYSLLVVFGENKEEYTDDLNNYMNSNINNRILFLSEIPNIEFFNKLVNEKYINNCSLERINVRPIFSIFTTSFNSFNKIIRAFNSLKAQTLTNWEWVIIDDSPDNVNFNFLKKELTKDSRVRLYKRFENNAYIGNVKNEASSLCRGQFVLELDHDDEILPFVLEESVQLFNDKPDVGFIYMDFINIYENGDNYCYGDHICKGYGSYYCQKYNDKWVYVYNTPNINNITLSHLVCCPNHPRIWRKDLLLEIGNFCEYLSICDDYEIILRTALNTKIAKIHKFGYIQYMNNENKNFSLIRNAEINRIGPNYISPIYYNVFDIHSEMKKLNAYEDEKYLHEHTKLWLRESTNYEHKYCNLLVNLTYTSQFCIIGLDGLLKNIDMIRELYKDSKNDFIVIENKCTINYLWNRLDSLGFQNMKCYTLIDETFDTLINYFKMCYLSTDNYEIITGNINKLQYNTIFNERHSVINSLTKTYNKYLEIGIENGYTFINTHFLHKVGVDPEPKCKSNSNNGYKIIKETSDYYFENIDLLMNYDENESIDSDDVVKKTNFDVVFIDGMHHCEYVLRDFNNSVKLLTTNGKIFLDDILPLNYNEQLKIPVKHYYENGVLKYGEEWTGDVWKFVYHLLKYYSDKFTFNYFYNINYRGVICINIKENFEVIVKYEELNRYDYFEDFNDYLKLLINK
jgi:glycosyltransferase involved in cell wall biosynthesis